MLEKDPKQRLGCGGENGRIEDVKNNECFNFNWKRIEAAIEKPPFIPDVRKESLYLFSVKAALVYIVK